MPKQPELFHTLQTPWNPFACGVKRYFANLFTALMLMTLWA